MCPFATSQHEFCPISASGDYDDYQSHEFGYPIIPREHPDSWEDTMYILHPHNTLPHDGFVTEWNLYANQSANLTLLIFRPDTQSQAEDSYIIIGYNNVTISQPGSKHFVVPVKDQVHFRQGDLIGMYFEGANPIPFSKGPDYGCTAGAMYVQKPCDFSVCNSYVFRHKQDGWNPCRVYSISAHIVNQSKSPEPSFQILLTSPGFLYRIFHG